MATSVLADPIQLVPIWLQSAQSSAFNTNTIDVQRFSTYAIQVNITNQSSLNCTVGLYVSVDKVNFVLVPSSTQTITTNTQYIWDVTRSGVCQARLQIAFTGGSAQFSAFGYAKL
jgi:hypothetical protein